MHLTDQRVATFEHLKVVGHVILHLSDVLFFQLLEVLHVLKWT